MLEVQGPERVVEVPGPERVVERIVEVPGRHRCPPHHWKARCRPRVVHPTPRLPSTLQSRTLPQGRQAVHQAPDELPHQCGTQVPTKRVT